MTIALTTFANTIMWTIGLDTIKQQLIKHNHGVVIIAFGTTNLVNLCYYTNIFR